MKIMISNRTNSRAPEGARLYAIGDVHGRLDLLNSLLNLIECDQKGREEVPVTLIFLGDYVDRGPGSKGVIDRLINEVPQRFNAIFLKGNHEDLLLSFVHAPITGLNWLHNGGAATLFSYGVAADTVQDAFWGDAEGLSEASRQFRAALPDDHLRFFQELKPCCRLGDYFFVHAGVRPGTPLDQQTEDDMLWIRNEFLKWTHNFGAVVVHGHTPVHLPEDLRNRIGLDTAAFQTGTLTAAGFEGCERWFLST